MKFPCDVYAKLYPRKTTEEVTNVESAVETFKPSEVEAKKDVQSNGQTTPTGEKGEEDGRDSESNSEQ